MTILGSLAMGTAIYNFASSSEAESEYPQHILESWAAWKAKYKSDDIYSSQAENSYRLSVFKQNYDLVEATNSNPKLTYTLELNQFADLTVEEFKNQYLRATPAEINEAPQPAEEASTEEAVPVAGGWDWTRMGHITRVKDQGRCGSCWAFAAIGALEALHKKTYGGNLQEFSEQQLVDCATGQVWPFEEPNYGCTSGNPGYALSYTRDYGAMLESYYPYRQVQGRCLYNTRGP